MFASATGCNDTHFRVTKENLKERAGSSRHSGSGSHGSSDSLMAVIVVEAVVIVIVVVGSSSSSSSSSSCRCCCNVVVALFPLLLSLPSSSRHW